MMKYQLYNDTSNKKLGIKARKSRKLRGHLYNFQKVLVPLITYTSRKDGLQIDSLSFSRAKI